MPAPAALNVLELRQIAAYLDRAADTYGDHSCNDFDVPDTPTHRKLLKAASAHLTLRNGGNADDEFAFEPTDDHQLITWDDQLMVYLSNRAEAFADRLEQGVATPVSAAELSTMASLLAMLAKNPYKEYPTGKGEEDGFLPKTTEGRALAEAVVRHKGGANVEKNVKQVLAGNKGRTPEGYELFDTWILDYLAMRCAALVQVAPARGIGFSEKDLPLLPLVERKRVANELLPSSVIVAPGISKDWMKHCKRWLKWQIDPVPESDIEHLPQTSLAHYVNNRLPYPGKNSSDNDWKLASNLRRWANNRTFVDQHQAITNERFDIDLWTQHFEALYASFMRAVDIHAEQGMMGSVLMTDVLTISLGFVLGRREEAKQLALVLLSGYRLAWLHDSLETSGSCERILEIVADFLNAPPPHDLAIGVLTRSMMHW